MEALLGPIRFVHIALGFIGLAAFWVPVLTKKGGARHKLFGKVFAFSGYVVGVTAVLASSLRIGFGLAEGQGPAANPTYFGFALFLGYLGWATIALVHHSIQTVRTRRNPEAIRTPLHHLLAIVPGLGSLVIIAYALLYWTNVSIVLLALSPVGIIVFVDLMRYMYRRPPEKMSWFYAHMGAMLGAGVAFHTAFLVFGSSRFLDLSILGSYNWVPWVLPGIIGTIGGSAWEKHYRRKFGDLPAKTRSAADAAA